MGTARKFRKNMPKGLAALKLKKGDKKDVYILSTKHFNVNMINTEKKRYKKDGGVANVVKPECVNEYNKGMGGVDKQDQVLACFPIMRKCMKGYKKIFFYMVDIALYNTHVLHSKIHGRKQNFTNFRLDIAEQLLSKIALPNYNIRGHPSQGDTPLRLEAKNWCHFPEHVPQTSKKQNPSKRCHVCAKHNIRSETTWQCKRCKVPLHLPKCFEQYHTLNEY